MQQISKVANAEAGASRAGNRGVVLLDLVIAMALLSLLMLLVLPIFVARHHRLAARRLRG